MKPTRQFWQWSRLGLLCLLFAQLLYAASQNSATIDEGFHITSGYEYLRTGKLRLFDEHAPLAKALFAWPLFFVPDLTPPESAPGYAEGDLITASQATVLAYRPIDRVIVACRIPVALLSVLLASALCRWATEQGHKMGGILALIFFCFDPNILAHGSLATTDMGATAFIFWTLMAFSTYLRRPTQGHWWLASILLGLAQATKLTALILLPILGLLMLTHTLLTHHAPKVRDFVHTAGAYIGMLVVAGIVLWATYGFEVRAVPELGTGTLPLPAASHIERGLRLRANLVYGRETFLLGQNRMHGWWLYFPIAFLVKTPLPTLLLVLIIPIYLMTQHRAIHKHQAANWLGILIFPLTYGFASLSSSINIGYRHLLPILPFIYLAIAELGYASQKFHVHIKIWSIKIIWITLCIGQAIRVLLIAPHYIPYFNIIAGGPDNGWRFLADSNTDWGQTLKALATYQEERLTGPLKLSLFTFLDPAAYGVAYTPIAPMQQAPPILPQRFNPEPGLYAISATTLDGVPLPYPATYDWFRHRAPLAQVAHAMHIYAIPKGAPKQWVAQCSQPVVPLSPEAIKEGFGLPNIRTITFDCEQGWIFPPGQGWYARATPDIDQLRWPNASEHHERWPSWTQKLDLDNLHISYEQAQSGKLPPFTIWEGRNTQSKIPSQSDSKVSLDETVTFLGYDAPLRMHTDSTVDILTYWRVISPPQRPLSFMLHLVSLDGVNVSVGDGLGVSIDQWQANDIIVNRHQLEIASNTNTGVYKLYSGAYWLDTMERLTSKKGETLELTSVQVSP